MWGRPAQRAAQPDPKKIAPKDDRVADRPNHAMITASIVARGKYPTMQRWPARNRTR